MQEAQRRASAIVDQAQIEAQNMKSDLTSEWEQSVKSITKLVVDKLLGTNAELQQQYLDTLVKEAAQK